MKKQLREIDDFSEYLEALINLDDCIVIVAAKDTIVPGSLISNITNDQYEKLNKIGLTKLTPHNVKEQFWCGYIGIVKNKTVISEKLVVKDDAQFYMNDNDLELSVFSSPHKKQNKSSIIVNGVELSVCRRGLDFVIIDSTNYRLVDSVAIDTWKDNTITHRKVDDKNQLLDIDTSVLANILSGIDEINKKMQKQNNIMHKIQETITFNNEKQELLLWSIFRNDNEDYKQSRMRFFKEMPQAEEPLRSIQKGGLVLLKHFDRICSENNIPYWATNGTLLGAVRHSCFIPWDDDVDVCMLRDDALRLAQILKNNDSFQMVESFKMVGPIWKYICRRCYFRSSLYKDANLYMDIFIMDIGDKNAEKEKIAELNNLRKRFAEDFWSKKLNDTPITGKNRCVEIFKGDENYNQYENFYLNYKEEYDRLLGDKSQKECIVWSIDNSDFWFGKKRVLKYDWIFPLQRIHFEGLEILAPNNTDKTLRFYYDDWLSLPGDMHTHFSTSEENINNIKSFIKEFDN